MYLFGGNYNGIADENGEFCRNIYWLNLKTMTWGITKTRGEEVRLRDEHTGVLDPESQQMIVFGGFMQGTRTNSVSIYNFTASTWTNVVTPPEAEQPCPRSGHAAVVYKGNMYVFGGKDDSSEKLKDFWSFNVAEQKWFEISANGSVPYERSGHSMVVYDDYIMVFGGIWDVTKELNDLHLYSLTKNEWITVQDAANSPLRSPAKSLKMKPGDSPFSATNPNANADSPNRLNRSMTK